MEDISVRIESRNQKLRDGFEQIIAEMKGFSVSRSAESGPCDLLILEIGDDPTVEFQRIQSALVSGEAKEVFLTSPRFDSDLLIQAFRTGVREFFRQPIKREEAKEALRKFKDRTDNTRLMGAEGKQRGKIIDVIGSKGGVGTTTVAVNLATSLQGSEKAISVALIDMNLLFGEIPIFLNVQSAFNWAEVAKNISRLDSTYLMGILTRHSSGIYLLPSPTALDGVNVATPEIIENILEMMQTVFEFIVIDGGQSLDEISLKILEMSDIVLPIAILSLPCLTNLKRLLWTFRKLGYPKDGNVKILINRYHKNSVISLKDAEESLNQKAFLVIPNDFTTTMSAINQGKTLSSVAPGSEISKSFGGLVSLFQEKEEKPKERTSFWRR